MVALYAPLPAPAVFSAGGAAAARRRASRASSSSSLRDGVGASSSSSSSIHEEGCDARWLPTDWHASRPKLSYDEDFCIVDRGCGNVMRRLTPSPHDVALLDELLAGVNFDASREEWIRLLSADDERGSDEGDGGGRRSGRAQLGATGVFNPEGELVGLVSTAVYRSASSCRQRRTVVDVGVDDVDDDDRRFGWCGNIVVRADYRKRGVASMVLRAGLDEMGAGVTAMLDASDMGLPLYVKAGFVPVARVRRYFLSEADAKKRSVARQTDVASEPRRMPPLERIDWNGPGGASVRAMDAEVFGADRSDLLAAWRDTCPELAVWVPGRAYCISHVRGNNIYLGPTGIMPRSEGKAGDEESGEQEDVQEFFEDVVTLALRTLVAHRDLAGIVAYVPESLEDAAEDIRAGGVSAASLGKSEEEVGGGGRAASAVRRVLEEAGFALEEITTRMARPGWIDDDEGGGKDWDAADDGDDNAARCVRLVDAQSLAPGDAARSLTVASLDLG